MIILGTKFYGHDSALCMLDTVQRRIFAVATERVTRIKHDEDLASVALPLLPEGPIDVVASAFGSFDDENRCCETKASGVVNAVLTRIHRDIVRPRYRSEITKAPDDLASEHPLAALAEQLSREAKNMLESGVAAMAVNAAMADKLYGYFLKSRGLSTDGVTERVPPVFHFDHHLCHAYSAYYSSPFGHEPSLVLTIDGQGDGYSSRAYIFRDGREIEIGNSPVSKIIVDNKPSAASLGKIYGHFTAGLGFKRNSDEGKVEALAAFGTPVPELMGQLRAACHIANNRFYVDGEKVAPFYLVDTIQSLAEKYGRENVAATVQSFLEDTVVEWINSLTVPSDVNTLCLAGGVTANIIMNLAIFERTRFKRIHVTPFMGDDGTALGAALIAAATQGEDIAWVSTASMPYFGPSYTREEVLSVLQKRTHEVSFIDASSDWIEKAAADIADNKIISLFQGRMEYGPRALGNRSILANPADPMVREKINVSIKRRPPWQPFCPSILEVERERLFTDSFHHKHMAIAFRMRPEFTDKLPSAVHKDGTARPQFVVEGDNPSYYALLRKVQAKTGFGVVINTSFNLHGRTIVMTPDHALDDFLACNLDVLYIEGMRVTRKAGA